MGVKRTELDQDTTKRADQRKEKEAMEDVGGFYLGSRLRRAASDNGHPARVTSYRTRTTSPRTSRWRDVVGTASLQMVGL